MFRDVRLPGWPLPVSEVQSHGQRRVELFTCCVNWGWCTRTSSGDVWLGLLWKGACPAMSKCICVCSNRKNVNLLFFPGLFRVPPFFSCWAPPWQVSKSSQRVSFSTWNSSAGQTPTQTTSGTALHRCATVSLQNSVTFPHNNNNNSLPGPQVALSTHYQNVSEMMSSWTSQKGFPLITVSCRGDVVTLTQEHFRLTTDNVTQSSRWVSELQPARGVRDVQDASQVRNCQSLLQRVDGSRDVCQRQLQRGGRV